MSFVDYEEVVDVILVDERNFRLHSLNEAQFVFHHSFLAQQLLPHVVLLIDILV